VKKDCLINNQKWLVACSIIFFKNDLAKVRGRMKNGTWKMKCRNQQSKAASRAAIEKSIKLQISLRKIF